MFPTSSSSTKSRSSSRSSNSNTDITSLVKTEEESTTMERNGDHDGMMMTSSDDEEEEVVEIVDHTTVMGTAAAHQQQRASRQEGGHSAFLSMESQSFSDTDEEEYYDDEGVDVDDDDDDAEDGTNHGASSSSVTIGRSDADTHMGDDHGGGIPFAKEELRLLRRSKCIFYLVMLIAAATSSFIVYRVTYQDERDSFDAQFKQVATEIAAKANQNVEDVVSDFETMALHVTSMVHAIPDMQWPNVTVPGFEALANDLRSSTGCFFAMFMVIVAAQSRDSYEAYQLNNTAWIEEALEYHDQPVEGNLDKLTKFKSPIMYEADREGSNRRPATPYPPGLDYFLPTAQISPLDAMFQFNFNILGIGAFREAYERSLGNTTIVLPIVETPSVKVVPTSDPQLGPSSFLSVPVWDQLYSMGESKSGSIPRASGRIAGQVPWLKYFSNIFDADVDPILLVVESTCDITLNFEIDGSDAYYWGTGEQRIDLDVKRDYDFEQQFTAMNRHTPCEHTLHLHPTQAFYDEYHTSMPLINAIAVSITFLITALAFVLYDFLVESRQTKIIRVASRSATIVSSLFPQNVRDRLLNDNDRQRQSSRKKQTMSALRMANGGDRKKNQANGAHMTQSNMYSNRMMTRTKKSKPIADLFPHATVLFADVVGFTAWSSVRQPAEVFELLEAIYSCFDKIARRLKVFKVETIGDCYVAVTGLPEPMPNHAVVMTRFAMHCVAKIEVIVRELAVTLGPDTRELKMRFGLHSGPVTAGVLRGDKSRFQLFGDTVNTAARMEQTSIPNRIQVSQETADDLIEAGKSLWIELREDKIMAKGKGSLQTYWVVRNKTSSCSTPSIDTTFESDSDEDSRSSSMSRRLDDLDTDPSEQEQSKHRRSSKTAASQSNNDRMGNDAAVRPSITRTPKIRVRMDTELEVQWNVDVLHAMLQKIVAMRRPKPGKSAKHAAAARLGLIDIEESRTSDAATAFNEITQVIELPHKVTKYHQDPQSVQISSIVLSQVDDYVRTIASMYRQNSFHNFSHASHVVQSTTKLLSRIVTADSIDYSAMEYKQESNKDLHKYTFGITSDPITQFACILAALVHDVDHTGLPNAQLVKEKTHIAQQYNNKSVAEQNSLDLSWDLLMEPMYADFRACIYETDEEFCRFRQLMVNMVLATDIMDKELGALRRERWETAFQRRHHSMPTGNAESNGNADGKEHEDANRMATIVIEHLIQASDVAHTMQHWHIFVKWNERLFHEMYKAYQTGRSEKDPSVGWYEGELGFFDYYVIPLARKLQECGVFGVSSDEYLQYAMANRKEWELRGDDTVAMYLKSYKGPKNKAA